MAQAVYFPGANLTLEAPESMPEVAPAPVFADGKVVVTCWRLSDEEWTEILRTGVVFLSVIGTTMPPVFVGSIENVRDVASQYGSTVP